MPEEKAVPVQAQQKVASAQEEMLPALPLKNAIAFASETIIPGGSNLVRGDLKQAALHGVAGVVARSLFGLPGMLLVASNSFVKATTGSHLHDLLGFDKPRR